MEPTSIDEKYKKLATEYSQVCLHSTVDNHRSQAPAINHSIFPICVSRYCVLIRYE